MQVRCHNFRYFPQDTWDKTASLTPCYEKMLGGVTVTGIFCLFHRTFYWSCSWNISKAVVQHNSVDFSHPSSQGYHLGKGYLWWMLWWRSGVWFTPGSGCCHCPIWAGSPACGAPISTAAAGRAPIGRTNAPPCCRLAEPPASSLSSCWGSQVAQLQLRHTDHRGTGGCPRISTREIRCVVGDVVDKGAHWLVIFILRG